MVSKPLVSLRSLSIKFIRLLMEESPLAIFFLPTMMYVGIGKFLMYEVIVLLI
jgi:hypothetical protein